MTRFFSFVFALAALLFTSCAPPSVLEKASATTETLIEMGLTGASVQVTAQPQAEAVLVADSCTTHRVNTGEKSVPQAQFSQQKKLYPVQALALVTAGGEDVSQMQIPAFSEQKNLPDEKNTIRTEWVYDLKIAVGGGCPQPLPVFIVSFQPQEEAHE